MVKRAATIFSFLIVLTITIAPMVVFAAGLVPDCGGGPCTFKELVAPKGLIDNVMQFLLFKVAVPGATLVILIAGIRMVINPENPQERKSAKVAVWSAIVGLLIALAAYVVVKTIVLLAANPSTSAGKAILNLLP